ncbi:MAG: efflux RND transporter periplasmic adaptor subunit [Sneathiellaceae bacterium]
MSKRSIVALSILLLAGMRPALAADPVIQVQTATAEADTYNEDLKVFGQVLPNPKEIVTVSTVVAGRVTRINVYPGERIVKGAEVVRIETAPDTESQVAQSENAVRYATEALAHVQKLFREKLATRDQLAAVQRDLDDARSKLEALSAIGANKEAQTLSAPSDGLVLSLGVKVGDQVAARQAIADLMNPSSLIVELGLEPGDASRLVVGDPVSVQPIEALENSKAPRIDTAISSISGILDPQTLLVPATVLLDGAASNGFFVNQKVRGAIRVSKQSAIRVPRDALVYEGSGPVVFVTSDGKAEKRTVEVVGMTDRYIYLSDGLRAGESVITGGLIGLADGAQVKVERP